MATTTKTAARSNNQRSTTTRQTTRRSQISDRVVQERAYQIFQARGFEHGRDFDDWLQAEKELKNGK